MKAYPLKSFSEFATPISRNVTVQVGSKYRLLGVRWWGEGAYERDTVDGVEIRAKKLSIVRAGDLIINKIWVRNGSSGLITDNLDGCAATGEFPAFLLDRQQVTAEWLQYLFKTKWFWHQCDLRSRGTSGKNRIKPQEYLAIKIPLPPVEEQRRIVARIEALAGKVERARQLRVASSAEVSALVSSIHIAYAKDRVLPLKDVIRLDEERVPVEIGNEYPQVGVRGFGNGLFAKPAINATQTTYKRFNRLYDGALVLSQVKGWEGAIAVCDKKLAGMFVSPEYRTFRCVDGESLPEYLSELVISPWFWKQLKQLQRGMGGRRQRTRPEHFLEMSIPFPTIERQRDAVEVFAKLKKVKAHQHETQPALDALLPAILDKAFKGEL